jgi:hypothetical protein
MAEEEPPGPPEASAAPEAAQPELAPPLPETGESAFVPPPENGEPPPETGEAPSEPSGAPLEPSDEPVDAGVPEPPPPPPEPGTEPPGRARGRVHVPTQEHYADDLIDEPPSAEHETGSEESLGDISHAPLRPEGAAEAPPAPEAPAEGEEKPELFDFETEEGSLQETLEPAAPADDFEALGPVEEVEEELDYEEDSRADEPRAEEPAAAEDEEPALDETAIREPRRDDDFQDTAVREPDSDDEPDILSESPEFAEEGTESEDLWFEKGPPQDFDFEEEEEDGGEERGR